MMLSQGVIDEQESEGADLQYPHAPPWSATSRRFAAVAWPSFLFAGVLELLVFAFVDPEQLHWLGGAQLEMERMAVYSLTFFMFWVVISLAGAFTLLLLQEPADAGASTERRFP